MIDDTEKATRPSARLRRFMLAERGKVMTVGGLLHAFGARAPGVLLMILGVFLIIPKAGLPVGAFAAAGIALIAIQLFMNKGGLAVPAQFAARELPRKTTRRVLLFSFRRFRWLEKYLKPRMGNFTSRAMQPLLGVVILLLAAVIALPIPFGDMIPGVAVLLIGAGLVIGDGVAIIVGLGASVLGIAVIFGLASALFFGGKAIIG
jgi:hypothetical protein